MSKFSNKFTANPSKSLLVGACAFGLTVTANATPAASTSTATMTKSKPVFLSNGGDYPLIGYCQMYGDADRYELF